MLEFLRRHSQTIMIVAVVVIISFMFWGSTTKTGVRGGENPADLTAFTIYGKDYSFGDKERLARIQLMSAQIGLYQSFEQPLSSYSTRIVTRDMLPVEFIFNRIILHHELEKNGLHASDAELNEEFKKLPAVQEAGAYSADRANNLEQHLNSQGLHLDDLYELIGDMIGWRKLQEIVAGNMAPSPQLASQYYVSLNQTIKGSLVSFRLDDFKKTIKIADEEIQKYYDQKKDEYQTTEKRTASYVFFPKPKDLDKATEDVRRKTNNDYANAVNEFSIAAVKPGADFDALAKAAKVEVKTLPAFTAVDPPAAIKDEYSLPHEIFGLDAKSRPTSAAIEGKDGYFVAHLISVEPRKQQELKEVEPKIRQTLTDQKAKEAIMKSANDARKSLEAALKEGKKFDEAAKAQNLTVQEVPAFAAKDTPKDVPKGAQVAGEALITPAGKFIKPIETPTGVEIFYVTSKELYKSATSATERENIVKRLEPAVQDTIFRAWFGKRKDEAKLNADPLIRVASEIRES